MFSSLIEQLPSLLLGLPIVLLSLSVHECAHGYVAYKLGDPTARNLGRLTLDPLKHIDPIGFICMVLFHVGWANPVPIVTRNFKNPRRDMAISASAGPLSNILLALVFAALLRLSLWGVTSLCGEDMNGVLISLFSGTGFEVSRTFTLLAIVSYMLFLGVIINFSYALFNLIPVPPLDGSRIFYVFLPTKWYFGIMKYERIIAIVMLVGLWTGMLTLPLNWAVGGLQNGAFWLFGIHSGSPAAYALRAVRYYVLSFI